MFFIILHFLSTLTVSESLFKRLVKTHTETVNNMRLLNGGKQEGTMESDAFQASLQTSKELSMEFRSRQGMALKTPFTAFGYKLQGISMQH